MPRTASRIRHKTQKILQSLSVEGQDFGSHWDAVKENRYDGTLSDEDFEKMCRFVRVAVSCGMPVSEFSQRQLTKPLNWRAGSIKRKTRKLCHKVRALMATRQRVTENHPPSDGEEDHQDRANRPENAADDPPNDRDDRSATLDNDPWQPPVVSVGQDSLGNTHSIIYQHWLGPENMRLREEPSTRQNQSLLQFATGLALFPTDLLEASAEDRYNFHKTVVCFEKEASVAQVPLSIPEPYRSACINKVRSCNPRLKPSHQECYESIVRCSKMKMPLHLTDLIAMLTFVHYCVAESGRNRWLWGKMKLAGAERFCDPQYEWSIDHNGVFRDDQGQSLANLVATELPMPRQRRKGRSQIGSKKDRTKFKRRILHVFQGYNEDGVRIYKTYYDKFLANKAAIRQLNQDQLDIATEIDTEERNAQHREENDENHAVPGHWVDEEHRSAMTPCEDGKHPESLSVLIPGRLFEARFTFPYWKASRACLSPSMMSWAKSPSSSSPHLLCATIGTKSPGSAMGILDLSLNVNVEAGII